MDFEFFIPEEILPMIYADVDRLLFLYQGQMRRRNGFILVLMYGIIFIMNLFYHMSPLSLVSMLISVTAIWYCSIRNVFGEKYIRTYMRRVQSGQVSKGLAGSWRVRITPEGYDTCHGSAVRQISCKEPRHVFQTDGAYFVFDKEVKTCDVFLKSMFYNEQLMGEWEQQYRAWGWDEKILDGKRVRRLAGSRWAAGAVFLVSMMLYMMEPVLTIIYKLYTNPHP